MVSRQTCQDIFSQKSGSFHENPALGWKYKVKYNVCKQAYPMLHKAFFASRRGQYVQGDEASAESSKVNTLDNQVNLEAHKWLDQKGWNEKDVAQIEKWKLKRRQEIQKGVKTGTKSRAFTKRASTAKKTVTSPKTLPDSKLST